MREAGFSNIGRKGEDGKAPLVRERPGRDFSCGKLPYFFTALKRDAQPHFPEPRIVVDDVTLDAQSDAPPKWRNIVGETRQKELKAQGEWSEELANEIRGSLQDAGFYNSAVTIETQTVTRDFSGMHVAVTAHVVTGGVYTISAVKFENADSDEAFVFPEETLRSLIPIQDGEIYRTDQIRQGLDQLKNLHGSQGYINFVAGVTTKVDEKTTVCRSRCGSIKGFSFASGPSTFWV